MTNAENQIVVYQPNETMRLDVRLENETVWLTQAQLCALFGVVKSNVSYHIKKIFGTNELDYGATVQKIRTVQLEAGRSVSRDIEYFNLDVIISLGYRINSKLGIQFRQWATRVLKEYLLHGQVINQRLALLEDKVERRLAKHDGEIAELRDKVDFFVQTKEQKTYKAEFVGVKTREELVRDYGYPAKGRAHGEKYLLFKTKLKYQHKLTPPEDAARVIVRTADFATAPKVRKQLKAYLESPDRADPDLAKRLPEILTKLRPEQLRVCEAAYQMNLFSWENLQPVHLPMKGEFTAVELFAGAGGLSIGLERAGIHVVIANEIMPDFAATLAANRLEVKVINEDSFGEAA